MFSIPRLTYGITPPKASYSQERRRSVAKAQSERIGALPVDALVVYDLQDESERTDAKRPFPFLETVPPMEYAYGDLAAVPQPKIVYRSVAHEDPEGLSRFLADVDAHDGAAVLVGAPSRSQRTSLSLSEAYALHGKVAPQVPLGGVLIAERHASKEDEHERVLRKVERGCSFFITQAVFSVTASKNVLSDLSYRCEALGTPAPDVLVTLSPCGSLRTLEFMRWLGVAVPRWIENELAHANDILETSIDLCLQTFAELRDFAARRGIELGCNVESVSLARAEIEASVEVVHRVARALER